MDERKEQSSKLKFPVGAVLLALYAFIMWYGPLVPDTEHLSDAIHMHSPFVVGLLPSLPLVGPLVGPMLYIAVAVFLFVKKRGLPLAILFAVLTALSCWKVYLFFASEQLWSYRFEALGAAVALAGLTLLSLSNMNIEPIKNRKKLFATITNAALAVYSLCLLLYLYEIRKELLWGLFDSFGYILTLAYLVLLPVALFLICDHIINPYKKEKQLLSF